MESKLINELFAMFCNKIATLNNTNLLVYDVNGVPNGYKWTEFIYVIDLYNEPYALFRRINDRILMRNEIMISTIANVPSYKDIKIYSPDANDHITINAVSDNELEITLRYLIPI